MKITADKTDANQLTIFVDGKINIATAEIFRKEVNRLSTGFGNVVFDFGGVNYISSAGLREILICRKKFVAMRIVNMQRAVYLIFDMTGFTNFIRVDRASNTPKSSEQLNEVDAPEDSNDICVPFKKFLRDKATYSADLSAVNVKHGNHVAICSANSINRVLTFYAIQKLGAIAVLVNFNLCAKEIAALIDYTDVTHFCYGEMPAPIDDVKTICGDKV